MEIIENKIIMIKEEDFILFDNKQISSTISKIRQKHFQMSKKFKIKVNYFKKISKEKTYVELHINKKMFEIIFYFGYLSNDTKKDSRKNFSSNLLDEIFINFCPLIDFKFFSDNLNFTSPYTLKYISKSLNHSLKLRNLEINNYVFDSKNTDFEFLIKLKNINIENIILTFSFDIFNYDLLFQIIENITSNNTNKISLTFLFKYIDIESFKDKTFSSKKNYTLREFNLNLIKFFPDKSVLICENDKSKISYITRSIMQTLWPSFLEVNFSEIIRAQVNQQIKYYFRKLNVKYSKENFFNLNVFKDVFFYKHLNNQKNKIFNILSLCSKFSFQDENLFKFDSHSFGLKLLYIERINLKKWHFYFIQEYDSHSVRKITTEKIKSKLYEKPSVDYLSQFNHYFYNFKRNDLNTVSRILTQIEGFSKVCNKRGEKIYIGGRMKTYDNQKEEIVLMNCILTFNSDYSSVHIRVYMDNVLIPHFNASSQFFRDNQIILNGGLTISKYREEFSKTPIFIVNLNNYQINKIIPKASIYPGVIFNHKTTIINENKILISDGYTLTNDDSNGIFMQISKQSKVSKNISFYEFDFIKGSWKLTVNDLKI